MNRHTRLVVVTVTFPTVIACFGPLPHPVTLTDFGQVEVGAAVQTLSAGIQFDGLAQIGVLPHLQLEALGGIDYLAQWQVQAGLRAELPLGHENGIQLAVLYDHQYYYSSGCRSDTGFFFLGGDPSCPPVSLNAGGVELGWAHEFGRPGPEAKRRPALGVFVELLDGQGQESSQTGTLLLIQARIAAEFPQGENGFAWLLSLGGTTYLSVNGVFANNASATDPLNAVVLGLGLLFGT
jgi:hypothetical protein